LMAWLRSVFSTTAARLSALYLLLFAICAIVLIFYMTGESVRFLTAQTRDSINEEIVELNGAYQRGGIGALVRTIDRRSRQPGANLYLVTDAAGRILVGNVEKIEPGILKKEGWTNRPFNYERFSENANERAHPALAQIIAMPNGMRVLVGRDLAEPERFRKIIRRSLILALGMMGLGALLIWYFVGRQALRRIDAVSVASNRIMGGDLTGRLPVTGSGDEFDRLAANLNAMLGRIGELNDGLKQVSDNIAHDLKTPLTRLRNRAEAALAVKQTAPAYRAAIEDMIGESDQLIKTFNAILMISRLEAGYSQESMSEADLSSIAGDVIELYEPVAEETGVALIRGTITPVKLPANRELVAQALSNIIDNAIKYSQGHAEKPAVNVELLDDVGGARIIVTDNGPGIPEQDRERATERFVRLEVSRSEPGSGLGLSLAKAVMKLHKGALKIGSANPGLRVELVFPKAAAK
jgi:signal transduction histidine kinase